jgi:hypothetical protein
MEGSTALLAVEGVASQHPTGEKEEEHCKFLFENVSNSITKCDRQNYPQSSPLYTRAILK